MGSKHKNQQPTRGRENLKQAAFLAAYAETGNVSHAARLADVDRTRHYDWLKEDEGYAAVFTDAHARACDALRAEARRRAVDGCKRPVFYKGTKCGVIREYSDHLLMFLMRGAMPLEFRESVAHTGGDGGPIQHAVNGQVAVSVARELQHDPSYLDYLRNRAVDSDSGTVRQNGKSGQVAPGAAPKTTRRSVNGNGHG